MIGLGTQITSVDEFNRRAAIALRSVNFGYGSAADIVASCQTRWISGQALTAKQQQAIFNICQRYRAQITDRMVTEFAALHAKGAD